MLEMHCVMASVRCGHVEAGRVNFCTVGGGKKTVMASLTVLTRLEHIFYQ